MKHILYKTINITNNRFYIGMHSTYNLDDGYLGSGKRLKAEIRKYGRESFKREILERADSREALKLREAEIVNEELLKNPLCLNLKNGGEGGGRIWNEVHLAKLAKGSSSYWKGRKQSNQHLAKLSASRIGNSNFKNSSRFAGKTHTQEAIDKMRMHKGKQAGEKNSQFGKCWITNGTKPLSIKKELLEEYLKLGYSKGRK